MISRMERLMQCQYKRNSLATLFTLLMLLNGCSPQSYFYYPNKKLYGDPAIYGIPYDTIEYPSLNGKKLWGIFMRTDKKPRGTVVHFHGNFGNLSNHFPLAVFLVEQ